MEIAISSTDYELIRALGAWNPEESAPSGAGFEIEEPTRVPGVSESAFEIIGAFGFTAIPVSVAVNLISSWIFAGLRGASSAASKASVTIRADGKETRIDTDGVDAVTLERLVAAAVRNVRSGS